MLDKIVLSSDRKSARVYFATDITIESEAERIAQCGLQYAYHSVSFSSDENVLLLLWEIVFEPSIRLEELAKEREARFLASLEDTVEIDIASFKDVA
jgi:hypothetical protein